MTRPRRAAAIRSLQDEGVTMERHEARFTQVHSKRGSDVTKPPRTSELEY